MDHDWCFFVVVPITHTELLRVMNGQRLVFRKLDPQSGQVRDAHIGCMSCEMLAEEAIKVDCPGEPKGYNDDGTPHW